MKRRRRSDEKREKTKSPDRKGEEKKNGFFQ